MRTFKRLFCACGFHLAVESFVTTVPSQGLTVGKVCACGRRWYDTGPPWAAYGQWREFTDEDFAWEGRFSEELAQFAEKEKVTK